MTFQFLEPNDADYEKYRIVELTKNEQWSLQDHYDDVMDNMRHVRAIASSTSISTSDKHLLVEEDFPFYDATDDDDQSYWYSSDTFACRVNRTVTSTKNGTSTRWTTYRQKQEWGSVKLALPKKYTARPSI
jgi:hypothetical protein